MLVLLFDIMEFGIVGGYLSKLCVTLPHMSISRRIVVSVAFHEVNNTPHCETRAKRNNERLKNRDCLIDKSRRFSSLI